MCAMKHFRIRLERGKWAPLNFCTFVANSALLRLHAFLGALLVKIWWGGSTSTGSSSARVASVESQDVLMTGRKSGPVDRTPGIPGYDKKDIAQRIVKRRPGIWARLSAKVTHTAHNICRIHSSILSVHSVVLHKLHLWLPSYRLNYQACCQGHAECCPRALPDLQYNSCTCWSLLKAPFQQIPRNCIYGILGEATKRCLPSWIFLSLWNQSYHIQSGIKYGV